MADMGMAADIRPAGLWEPVGMDVLLEVCVDSASGLGAAVAGGAARIELCAALELGGLTPSAGLMRLAVASGCSTYAMIRPRAGDFVFREADLATMLADIDAARAAGLRGVVLGASRPDGTLDSHMLSILLRRARGMGATLHRAFDIAPDRVAALETAISLGFERVLTSGAAVTALEGASELAGLVARAGSRLSIMAGGGIGPANVAAVVAATGVREVHASCRGPALREARADGIGMALGARQETSAEIVERMVSVLGAGGADCVPLAPLP
jgi:copper homeostasis protein